MMHIYPAIVRAYDRETRQCRIEIPGLTDGADVLPLAECLQPLGDRTADNETRIKPGDDVFVQFLQGDPRHPVIIGFRAKNTGNNVGRRHFEQDNIHTEADETQLHTAGTSYTIEAGDSITLKVGGSTIVINASGITATAPRIDLNE